MVVNKLRTEERSRRVGLTRTDIGVDVPEQERRLRSAGCVDVRQFTADNIDAEFRRFQEGDTVFIVSISMIGPPIGRVVEYVCMLIDSKVTLVAIDENLEICPAVANAQSEVFRGLASCMLAWERRRAEARRRTLELKQKRAGRQPKLSENDSARVIAMLKEPGATVPKVAANLGIGRTTLYRYLQDVGYDVNGKP